MLHHSYAPDTGMTTCVACPDQSNAGEGQPACSCNTGWFMFNLTCLPCPPGALCDSPSEPERNFDTLRSMAGFWRYLDPAVTAARMSGDVSAYATPRFYRCPLGVAACPSSENGTCTVGYGHVTCGVCEVNYHATGASCVPCKGATLWLLAIVIAGAVLLALLVRWAVSRFDTSKLVNSGRIIINCTAVAISICPSLPWGVLVVVYLSVNVVAVDRVVLAVAFVFVCACVCCSVLPPPRQTCKSWVRPRRRIPFRGLRRASPCCPCFACSCLTPCRSWHWTA